MDTLVGSSGVLFKFVPASFSLQTCRVAVNCLHAIIKQYVLLCVYVCLCACLYMCVYPCEYILCVCCVYVCICVYICVCVCVCVCVCMCACRYVRAYLLEMQRYIDISSYCDTLGSDTVSIYTHLGCIDISNIVIYQCIVIKIYTFTYN